MRKLKLGHLNVRSLLNKFNDIRNLVVQEQFHVFGITETWLKSDVGNNTITLPGFSLFRSDRVTRGGGVGIYVCSQLNPKVIRVVSPGNFLEHIWISFKLNGKSYAIGIYYRPPKSNVADCIECIDSHLSYITPLHDEIFCLGDFNINLLDSNNLLAPCFESYEFCEMVREPTRISFHGTATLLDPIFSSDKDSVFGSGVINTDHISDHCCVFCVVKVNKFKFNQKFVTFRDFKNFNLPNFLNDIQRTPFHHIFGVHSIDRKVQIFNDYLIKVFDTHAPVVTARVSKPKCPWLTENSALLMKRRDQALAKYKRSKNRDDFDLYKLLRNSALSAIRRDKKMYMQNICRTNNSKVIWKALEDFNVKKRTSADIPAAVGNATDINNFFVSSFKHGCDTDLVNFYDTNSFSDCSFNFTMATVQQITEFIASFRSNACGADDVSPVMLQYCSPVLDLYIAHIVNSCIEVGCFPSDWKTSIIIPLPKKSTVESISDLRPISILPALSKVLEKVLLKQINEYVNEHNILPLYQSGFRQGHSTVTALSRVTDDIVSNLDRKRATALVLLDFSKAFDTISHAVLISKLKYYGFSRDASSIIASYLSNRTQKVSFNSQLSPLSVVSSGVPQGSVLGPLLFSLYTADILNRVKFSRIQAYADDTQLYIDLDPRDSDDTVAQLNEDLETIRGLSLRHNLLLNPTKCSLIFFANKNLHHLLNDIRIQIGSVVLPPQTSSKSLGLILDDKLQFTQHINGLLPRAYLSLKLLYANRHCFDVGLRKLLCESLVLSLFNYGSVVYGNYLNVFNRRRIQRVQNACCRYIFGLRKYDHVSATLAQLNWLHMENRRRVLFLTFIHRIITTQSPLYLYDKLSKRQDFHSVNVRSRASFHVPRHRTALFQRCFSYCSATLYNRLSFCPNDMGIFPFKKKLKRILLLSQN